jgi:hypothetical protein
MFREFPAFAPAFERGPSESGAYLALLNLNRRPGQAVLIVARCLEAAEDKRKQVSNLLRGSLGFEIDQLRAEGVRLSDADLDSLVDSSNWRPQLVGCVALLATNPRERPLGALLDAASRPSWVSPQLLATTALVDAPNWPIRVESAILARGDAKAAAALCALAGERSSELIDLANRDTDTGDGIALGWRDGITTAFDKAGVPRSW